MRILIAAAAAASLGSLSAASAGEALPAGIQAQLQSQAEKACETALDTDRFDYNTMEECVADKTAKLARAYKPQAAAPQTHQSASK